MNIKELTQETIKIYSKLLTNADIRLNRQNEIYFPELLLICGQIDKFLPDEKVKHLDFKFGVFRFTFIKTEVIPEELNLDSVVFYQ